MKLQYERLEDVPEELRDHYQPVTADDGSLTGFRHRELDGWESPDEVQGLKSALRKERENARDGNARAVELEAELTKLRGESEQRETKDELRAARLDAALTKAIAEAEGSDLLAKILGDQVVVDDHGVVSVVDEQGRPVLGEDGAELTLRQHLAAMRDDPRYQPFFAARVAGGGSGIAPNEGEGTSGRRTTGHAITRRSELRGPEAHKAFLKQHGRQAYLALQE